MRKYSLESVGKETGCCSRWRKEKKKSAQIKKRNFEKDTENIGTEKERTQDVSPNAGKWMGKCEGAERE